MRVGIVVFPGTNCDTDTKRACELFGWNVEYVWHDEIINNDFEIIFLPGGFSYGDYIRAGALASRSPIITSLKNYKGMIVGICNGFQILCETGLLQGALTINENNHFICDEVDLISNNKNLPLNIKLPIANKEGRYYNPNNIEEDMILFKYNDNPNGSDQNIAGIFDKEKKIIGMMPHPERAVFEELGNVDGRKFFKFLEREVNAL